MENRFCPVLVYWRYKKATKGSDEYYELKALLDGYGGMEPCNLRCECMGPDKISHDNSNGDWWEGFYKYGTLKNPTTVEDKVFSLMEHGDFAKAKKLLLSLPENEEEAQSNGPFPGDIVAIQNDMQAIVLDKGKELFGIKYRRVVAFLPATETPPDEGVYRVGDMDVQIWLSFPIPETSIWKRIEALPAGAILEIRKLIHEFDTDDSKVYPEMTKERSELMDKSRQCPIPD